MPDFLFLTPYIALFIFIKKHLLIFLFTSRRYLDDFCCAFASFFGMDFRCCYVYVCSEQTWREHWGLTKSMTTNLSHHSSHLSTKCSLRKDKCLSTYDPLQLWTEKDCLRTVCGAYRKTTRLDHVISTQVKLLMTEVGPVGSFWPEWLVVPFPATIRYSRNCIELKLYKSDLNEWGKATMLSCYHRWDCLAPVCLELTDFYNPSTIPGALKSNNLSAHLSPITDAWLC